MEVKQNYRGFRGVLMVSTVSLALLAGCQAPAQEGGALLNANADSTGASPAARTASPAPIASPAPVRVSRVIFEKPLQAAVRVVSSAGEPIIESSSVSWMETPVEVSVPPSNGDQPVVVFHDTIGCATLDELAAPDPVQVCFKLMGDVSSAGLNEKEMWVTGLREWLRDRGTDVGELRLRSVQREDSGFALVYDAATSAGAALSIELRVFNS